MREESNEIKLINKTGLIKGSVWEFLDQSVGCIHSLLLSIEYNIVQYCNN